MNVTFYTTAGEAWDAMYADCAAAGKSIFFEQYILMQDEAGNRFLSLFAEKARAGVFVHLVLDPIGSGNFETSPFIKAIRDAGGIVKAYNRLSPFSPRRWFPRDHCKTLLIDDEIAYTGSACVQANMKNWRDTHVRFTGPAVEDVRRSVAHFSIPSFRSWLEAVKERRKMARQQGDYRYVVSRPGRRNPIYRELLQNIHVAKSEIILVTPYLVLPGRLRRALRQAVIRGVKVSLMVSEKGDIFLADAVARTYFPRLLNIGMQIWLYRPDTVMHAKLAVVDDSWAMVGSTNLDYLSLLRNREGNLMITDKAAIAALREHFRQDVANSTRATHEYHRNLPWWYKAVGYMARGFESFI